MNLDSVCAHNLCTHNEKQLFLEATDCCSKLGKCTCAIRVDLVYVCITCVCIMRPSNFWRLLIVFADSIVCMCMTGGECMCA